MIFADFFSALGCLVSLGLPHCAVELTQKPFVVNFLDSLRGPSERSVSQSHVER